MLCLNSFSLIAIYLYILVMSGSQFVALCGWLDVQGAPFNLGRTLQSHITFQKAFSAGFLISVESQDLRVGLVKHSSAVIKQADHTAAISVSVCIRATRSMTSEHVCRAAIIVALRTGHSRIARGGLLKTQKTCPWSAEQCNGFSYMQV